MLKLYPWLISKVIRVFDIVTSELYSNRVLVLPPANHVTKQKLTGIRIDRPSHFVFNSLHTYPVGKA